MRHPYEKILRLELFTLGLSILTGFIALFQASVFLIVISFYLLAISLACDAFIHLYFHMYQREMQGMKQIIRGAVLFLLSTVLIFIS